MIDVPTPALAGLLLRAVPQPVRRDAHVAMHALAPWGAVSAQLVQDTGGGVADHDVHVDGDPVQIPYRVSFPWPPPGFVARFSPRRQAVVAAWMSRSENAGVRQRAVRELFCVHEPWVVPFVVQLCGEHVHEIAADVDRFVRTELPHHDELRHAYGRFVRDNPRYLATTRHRAVAFRELDHRWPHRGDPDRRYPQLAALDALAELAYRGGSDYPGDPAPARIAAVAS
ncbi:hypothetical protein Ae168Ps1_1576c [Pseudonocardia sp. Ae168_Ps1]|uniref:hypothetical protein n=1 Tax=unclassified Pseudonocardia TaxID=2619320 RepID=UPI00094AE545|nr:MULTISPECIES: hypothetical protein [unclassified Pseudonocardia]OLL73193.1 hypothetical protein Ae150APs1_1571c [Pseudonocardia sp. Ae150A_Ps1]OLL79170.1 hypothetical protein Ae168Ps1_1576c [Pseudonocardia sp. Ae168_Ps1]OLL86693.1 hypothetical protein Ae263Ps1_3748 [Pseudonocardia sp. Ae263_Ps1]OLL93261.1 hypothetical protein Ae356Ps1_3158c [Pseudonocardia sp. Ae356_Ps1]